MAATHQLLGALQQFMGAPQQLQMMLGAPEQFMLRIIILRAIKVAAAAGSTVAAYGSSAAVVGSTAAVVGSTAAAVVSTTVAYGSNAPVVGSTAAVYGSTAAAADDAGSTRAIYVTNYNFACNQSWKKALYPRSILWTTTYLHEYIRSSSYSRWLQIVNK